MSRLLSKVPATGAFLRARMAVLLLPALLGGCYVVPIVPVGRPLYRPYPGPYYGPHRGYYRGVGEADVPGGAVQRSDAPTARVHIEVASSSR